MDDTKSAEPTPLQSFLSDPQMIWVQPSLFQRDHDTPLMAQLSVCLTDGEWSVGLTLVELDTLQERALTASPAFEGRPTSADLTTIFRKLLDAADLARGPFGP